MRSNKSREKFYFLLCALTSALVYIFSIFTIIGIGIVIGLVFVFAMMQMLMLGTIKGNSVKITEKQFPDLHQKVVELSESLQLKKVPAVYVMHSEGALNAFASRFVGKHMVVLYSEVFELAREKGEKELSFVIAHELAHIKRQHVLKQMWLFPAQLIPFLGQAYSRACEYTCDEIAAEAIGDREAATRALTILGIGKKLYREVNVEAYLEQIHSDYDAMTWLSEKLSTHPFLPHRIQAIHGSHFRVSNRKVFIGLTAFSASAVLIYVIFIASLGGAVKAYEHFFEEFAFSVSDEDWMYDEDLHPLIQATIDSDLEEIQWLLDDGEDIDVVDYEESTALIYSVYDDDLEVAEFLLQSGANPDHEDVNGTAFTLAIMFGQQDMAVLLYEYGADLNYVTTDGESVLSLLNIEDEEEFYEAIDDL